MDEVPRANRWAFLAAASIVHITSCMHNDQLAPMVNRICGTSAACSDGTDSTCLSFNPTYYNSLYASFDWAAMLGATFGGFLLRKYGIWLWSWINAILIFVGMLLVTLGPYLNATNNAAFCLVTVGRVLFGFSFFFEIVLTLQVLSHWFPRGQLGAAYAVYFAAGKIGNIIAVVAAGFMVELYGLQMSLWIFFAVECLGVICCVVAGTIYKRMEQDRYTSKCVKEEVTHKVFAFDVIRQLSLDFWIIVTIICLYYSVALGSQPDLPKFLIEAFSFTEGQSGVLMAINPIMALFAPLFGILIDRYGHRSTQTFCAMILVFLPLVLQAAIPTFPPVYTILLMGLTYAICSASLWSSISVIEHGAVVGIAMGIATGAEQFGVGLNMLVNGYIVELGGSKKWNYFFGLQAALVGIAWLLSMISMGIDWKWRGRRLLKRPGNKVPTEKTPLLERVTSSVGSVLSNLPPE